MLKVAATLLTFMAAAAAAIHVSAHVKNTAAPLHPGVVGTSAASPVRGGHLSLTPSVRSSDQGPITSTYVS
jgi:hypothetical protein